MLLSSVAAFAQGTLTGPSLGLIFDPAAQAIRPILGVPGAASVGSPLDAGFPVTSAVISPTQSYALAVSGANVYVVNVSSNTVSAQAIGGASAEPDRMVLSPSGSAAVLYYKSGSIQIVTGLPGAPQLGSQISIAGLPNAPGALAVSDDGAVVIAGLDENPSPKRPKQPRPRAVPLNGLYVIPLDGSAPQRVSPLRVSALAFFAKSHDALVADRVANSITLIRDIAGQANIAWTFSNSGLQEPDAVAASADGTTVLAASSKTGVLVRLDARGANPVFVPCKCAPSEMRPLTAPGVYQVTEAENGLLWIFDSNPQNARVLFVPAGSSVSSMAAVGTDGR